MTRILLPLIAILAIPAMVSAQDLGAARTAYLDADFERARTLFGDALASPTLDAPRAIETLRYLVALDLLLGDLDAARLHAASVVALDRDAVAPEGAPDEAGALLDAARSERPAPPALIITPESMAAGAEARVELTISNAPPIVTGLLLVCRGRNGAHEARGSLPTLRLATTESAGDLTCTASATTASGALLIEHTQVLARQDSVAAETPGAAASTDPDWALILGLTAAGVVLVTAVIVITVFATASPGNPSFGPTTVCGAGWSSC